MKTNQIICTGIIDVQNIYNAELKLWLCRIHYFQYCERQTKLIASDTQFDIFNEINDFIKHLKSTYDN